MTALPAARRGLAALVAVGLTALGAAGLVAGSAAPASAALCSGTGVNVVVDYQGLGGGVRTACDAGGANRTANQVFPDAGFTLTYAQQQPGFVCRVDGVPSSDPCFNTSPSNAYWGLYWSDGSDGAWHYASTGVGGLKVPAGGSVAFSWQNGGTADPPGVAPPVRSSGGTSGPTGSTSPTASPQPTPRPSSTTHPSAAAHAGSAVATSTPRAHASAAARAAKAAKAAAAKAAATASPSASTTPTDAASPTDPASSPARATASAPIARTSSATGGGLPLWVPAGVVVLLLAGAGGTVWWRSRP